jgi:hypothetical protein
MNGYELLIFWCGWVLAVAIGVAGFRLLFGKLYLESS